jgi:hypothetical protein
MSYLGDAAENRLQVRLIRTSFDLRKHRSSSAAYPPIKREFKKLENENKIKENSVCLYDALAERSQQHELQNETKKAYFEK